MHLDKFNFKLRESVFVEANTNVEAHVDSGRVKHTCLGTVRVTQHVVSRRVTTAFRKFPEYRAAECQFIMSDESDEAPSLADTLADRKRFSDFKALLDSSDTEIPVVRDVIGKICSMVAEGVDRYTFSWWRFFSRLAPCTYILTHSHI